jgi:hypothetical protein
VRLGTGFRGCTSASHVSAATIDANTADGGFVSELVAYIDPGSGSLIIQVAIATLVAIPIFFRTQIGRIVNRFRGRTEVQAPADDRADGD